MAETSSSTQGFQLVVAATNSNGIGKGGELPWASGSLTGDMSYFKELTSKTKNPARKNAVIMGRKTWESIPAKFRPLPGRLNVVITSRASAATADVPAAAPPTGDDACVATVSFSAGKTKAAPSFEGATTVPSLTAALEFLRSPARAGEVETLFVIGGGQVYAEALARPDCRAVHLTRVEADLECDTHLPPVEQHGFRLWSQSTPQRDPKSGLRYTFLCYTPAAAASSSGGGGNGNGEAAPVELPAAMASKHEEYQYLELASSIIDKGVFRPDRTGTGTYSLFGTTMRYSLRNGSFPLLTTKRVFWRGVAEELLWFVKGSTNAKELQDKGVHIWDGNSSREYLDSIGLMDREVGDLGPVYGFQWRHFGAEYTNMHASYEGQGVDQLADCIHRLKTNPYDRRIIMTAWNPAALKDMALPPCHMFCQFYVADGELSCLLYQRSCDLGLGVPFNIASYALLTCMVAQVCGLQRGEFVHMMGDTHVYKDHVGPLQEQMLNPPRHFPTLKINPAKMDIDSFVMEDFELVGYNPHKKIAMKMSV